MAIWGMAPVATRALVLQLAPLPLLVVRMGLAAVVLLPWCGPVLRGLPLARYLDLPRFLRATMLIRAQLTGASGLVGYALDAHLARKTFWTVPGADLPVAWAEVRRRVAVAERSEDSP